MVQFEQLEPQAGHTFANASTYLEQHCTIAVKYFFDDAEQVEPLRSWLTFEA